MRYSSGRPDGGADKPEADRMHVPNSDDAAREIPTFLKTGFFFFAEEK